MLKGLAVNGTGRASKLLVTQSKVAKVTRDKKKIVFLTAAARHHHHHHFRLLDGTTERKPIHVAKQYRGNKMTSANNSFCTSGV